MGKNATRDAEETRQYMEEVPTDESLPYRESLSPNTAAPLGMKRVESFGLFQSETDPSFNTSAVSLVSSKGFGFSRDELEQVGLRANGRRDEGSMNGTA